MQVSKRKIFKGNPLATWKLTQTVAKAETKGIWIWGNISKIKFIWNKNDNILGTPYVGTSLLGWYDTNLVSVCSAWSLTSMADI